MCAAATVLALGVGCEAPAPVVPAVPGPRPTAADPSSRIRCAGGLLCEAASPLCGWRVPAACERRSEQGYLCSCRLVAVRQAEVREFFASRYAAVQPGPEGALVIELPQAPVFPGGPAPTAATLRIQAGNDGAEQLLLATPPGTSRLGPAAGPPGNPVAAE